MVVDALQNGLRSVELDEEHDEDAVVGQLLEFSVADFVVLKQHPCHYAQNLEKKFLHDGCCGSFAVLTHTHAHVHTCMHTHTHTHSQPVLLLPYTLATSLQYQVTEGTS